MLPAAPHPARTTVRPGFIAAQVTVAYLACVLLLDRTIAALAARLTDTRFGTISAAVADALDPRLFAAAAACVALGALLAGAMAAHHATARRLADHTRRWLFVVLCWGGAVVVLRSLDVLLNGLGPRTALASLACACEPAADVTAFQFLSGTPETVVALTAGIVLAYPGSRFASTAVAVAAVAALAAVFTAVHYLGDVALASALAIGWAFAAKRLYLDRDGAAEPGHAAAG